MGRRNSANENNKRQIQDTKRETIKKINLKDKLKLDKSTITTIAIAVVICICIICIKNYTALGLVLNKNITDEEVRTIELATSNNKIFSLEENILVLSKGELTCYTQKGIKKFVIKLDDTLNIDVNTNGKYIQIINKDKGYVYVYEGKYEVARIKIEGTIYSGNVNEKGVSVIEYTTNGNKTILGIFDSKGNVKYNVKLASNIVGKYIVSRDFKYLAYVDLNISGISAKTTINLIDLKHISEDSINIQNIYESNNSIAYDIYFNKNKLITRFAEEYYIYNCSNKEGKLQKISTGSLTNIDNYNNRYASLEINEQGNYILNISKLLSSNKKIIELKDKPKYFVYENGLAYVCYQKQILVFNNLGNNIKTYTSNNIITDPIVFNFGKSVAISIANKIIMFTI